jgi:glucose/arabinose dehydrogenase
MRSRTMLLAILIALSSGCSRAGAARTPSPTESPSTIGEGTTQQPATRPATEAASATPLPPTQATAEATAPPSVLELPDPAGVTWTPVAEGFVNPLGLVGMGDERLFLLEQPGVVRIIQGDEVLDPSFLDIRDRVDDGGLEQGLLGMAFDPDYAANGAFYLYYTGQGGEVRIASYQVSADDPNRADPGSERILLRISEPYANHNGGELTFGPDGYLYAGVGDGGSAGDPQGNGQNPGTLLGSILRLAVNSGDPYTIPPDNPFGNGGGRPEVWAYGLRNPWRFSFDPASGDLYIGDVGQDRWEEVDFLPAGTPGGTNFGWNVREGLHPYTGDGRQGLVDPVAEYSHDSGCSITGGVVARDPDLPDWNGVYLYGDYCSGLIWGLVRNASGDWMNSILFETGFRVSSFGRDSAGSVYVLDLNGGLYRLAAVP